EEGDYAREELPLVFGMIGPVAIRALTGYLAEEANGLWPQAAAAAALQEIGTRHPEAAAECVAALVRQLDRHDDSDPTLNACLISELATLKATDALPDIRRAYQSGCVDFTVIGDYEDVEIYMGVRE